MTTIAQPSSDEYVDDDDRRGVPTKLLLSLAVLGLVAAVFTVTSLALFTDQASTTDNVFSTGSIQIDATPASAVVTMTEMIPGDQTTAPLTIENNGSLELRYAATSELAGDATLGNALQLTIKSNVTACTDAGWTADGLTLYSGALGGSPAAALFGDAGAGAQAGDRVLAAGADETLCVNVSLPLSADNSVQGMAVTGVFNFYAEQTANNP